MVLIEGLSTSIRTGNPRFFKRGVRSGRNFYNLIDLLIWCVQFSISNSSSANFVASKSAAAMRYRCELSLIADPQLLKQFDSGLQSLELKL